MLTTGLLLIFFTIIWSQLSKYIKNYKSGFEGESDDSFWMFSYDFKSHKKQDYTPDSAQQIRRKKFKNRLIFALYLTVFIQFLLLNSLISHLLILIS